MGHVDYLRVRRRNSKVRYVDARGAEVISADQQKRLQLALAAGLSDCAAAIAAGVHHNTSREWRKAFEGAGVLPPITTRRDRRGRLVRVENVGASMRPSLHPQSSYRRILILSKEARECSRG